MKHLPGHRLISSAVMAQRVEPATSLDFFPTPPWGTRAAIRHVLPRAGVLEHELRHMSVWDPVAGEGHMAGVLEEASSTVLASDIAAYPKWHGSGRRPALGDFMDLERMPGGGTPDIIIMNPPFRPCLDMILHALHVAPRVAVLVRPQLLEGVGRYHALWTKHPPALFAQYSQRLPMVAGRWAINATTATAYAWFFWNRDYPVKEQMMVIPPCRDDLQMPGDICRFGGCSDLPNSHPVAKALKRRGQDGIGAQAA